MNTAASGRFTGWHMTVILIAFFAVVIAVNVVMAAMASATFGGVVVENSYVASQHFNRWLDVASAEKSLGWGANAMRTADNHLTVSLSGLGSKDAALAATARHPLGRSPDQILTFFQRSDGSYQSDQKLPAGRWRLRLEITAQGEKWRTERDVP